jgi:hypothetical protein
VRWGPSFGANRIEARRRFGFVVGSLTPWPHMLVQLLQLLKQSKPLERGRERRQQLLIGSTRGGVLFQTGGSLRTLLTNK